MEGGYNETAEIRVTAHNEKQADERAFSKAREQGRVSGLNDWRWQRRTKPKLVGDLAHAK